VRARVEVGNGANKPNACMLGYMPRENGECAADASGQTRMRGGRVGESVGGCAGLRAGRMRDIGGWRGRRTLGTGHCRRAWSRAQSRGRERRVEKDDDMSGRNMWRTSSAWSLDVVGGDVVPLSAPPSSLPL
jgi:hypothetical protein